MDIDELWGRYKKTQDRAVWEKIVGQYAALVKHVAGRLQMLLPAHVDYDDLVGNGVFGLLTAIERFEPERGVKFETFATTRIRGAILDSLRAADWAPRSLRQREREIAQAYGTIERRFGRPAKAIEVSAELGMDLEELHELERQISQASFLSLDAPLQATEGGEKVPLGMKIATQEGNPIEALEEAEKQQILAQAVQALPEREQLVVSLYYYEDLNIKEIAQIVGVTESRISQLHTRSLLRLRGHLLCYSEELDLAERSQKKKKRVAGQVR